MAANTALLTPERSVEIKQHAEAGLQADPDNARLLGLLAFRLTGDFLNGWNNVGQAEIERAEDLAGKAISLDPSVARAHHALGWVYRIRGDHQAALDALRQTIKVDPNFAPAYAQAGNEMLFLGDLKGAIEMAEKAQQLSPKDPSFPVFKWVEGRAYFALGDYAKAAEALQESVNLRPTLWFVHAWLTSALAHSTRDSEAKRALGVFQQHHSTWANLASVNKYYADGQYQNPTAQAAVKELLNGLRKAGVN